MKSRSKITNLTPTQILATRKRLGMTMRQFGRAVGLDPQVLSRVERGYQPVPNWMVRQRIARIIHLTDHLLARRANPDWSL